MRRKRNPIRRSGRRGAALIVAIVCVSIAVAVMYGITQLAVQAHREVELQQRRAQAGWIAESAADRAAARLTGDAEYAGEEWLLSAGEIGGRYDAKVRISVDRIEEQPGWCRVRVVADYPADLPLRGRQTREFRMPRTERRN